MPAIVPDSLKEGAEMGSRHLANHKENAMNRISSFPVTAIAAALLLAGTVHAQPFDPSRNPHLSVSSDGGPLHAAKISAREARGIDSFEGFGPSGPDVKTFEDSGAAIDGAEPVMDEAADFWAAVRLPGLGGGDSSQAKSIIGVDSRSLVSATTTFPWRAIALVTFDGGRCTGWFISKDTVVTAGHCVHTGGTAGKWQTNVRVYPGRNGTASPYGVCTAKRLN
jgi:glutamyl endopeptidase